MFLKKQAWHTTYSTVFGTTCKKCGLPMAMAKTSDDKWLPRSIEGAGHSCDGLTAAMKSVAPKGLAEAVAAPTVPLTAYVRPTKPVDCPIYSGITLGSPSQSAVLKAHQPLPAGWQYR